MKYGPCSQSLTLQPVSFSLKPFNLLFYNVSFSEASIFCNILTQILRTHFLFPTPNMFSANQKPS